MSPTPQAKLDAARIEFNKSKTYAMWQAWAMHLPDRLAKEGELPYPTAATNGVEIIWHPEFVAEHPISELVKVLAHEVGHCTLYHTAGRGKELSQKYSPELANIALDHAVNNLLVECGVKLDSSWVCDTKYRGWSAEDIAYDLSQDTDSSGTGTGTGASGTGGGHELMENQTQAEAKAAQDKSDSAMADGSIMDSMKQSMGVKDGDGDPRDGQGTDSMGSLMDAARAARHKAKDWRTELEEFTGTIRNGERTSTYSKLCRRPIKGVIRPGHRREGKPHIGVVVDTSGSMYSDLPKVMVELEVLNQDGFTFDVVCTDGNVYGPYHFDRSEFDYQSLPLEGGGGSDMVPAFEKIAETCPDADALVFCTDGCIDWPSEKLLNQLPPCVLVEFSNKRSTQGKRFSKHLLVK